MLPSSSEQLILAYHKARDIAVNDLAKVHARLFNSVGPHIDRISSMLVSEIKPLLRELKKAFPTYHFFILPMTETCGNDIAPMYEVHVETRWFVFYLNEDYEAYGISTLDINKLEEYPKLSEKLDDLEKSFLKFGIAFSTLIPPDKKHLEVMLSHKSFD